VRRCTNLWVFRRPRISKKVPQTYVSCTSFICIRYHSFVTQAMLHVIHHGRDTIGIYLSAHLPASWAKLYYMKRVMNSA
jgi:hypothetical protein